MGQLNLILVKLLDTTQVLSTRNSQKDHTDKENLSYLVGKHIKHKFIEDGQLITYSGRVISQVPGFPNWFNVTVVYTCEPDIIYTMSFNLSNDLKNRGFNYMFNDLLASTSASCPPPPPTTSCFNIALRLNDFHSIKLHWNNCSAVTFCTVSWKSLIYLLVNISILFWSYRRKNHLHTLSGCQDMCLQTHVFCWNIYSLELVNYSLQWMYTVPCKQSISPCNALEIKVEHICIESGYNNIIID